MRLKFKLILLFLFLFSTSEIILAQNSDSKYLSQYNYCVGIDYYKPTESNREIRSSFASFLIGKEFINQLHYSLYAGLAATFAKGNIIQWDDNLKDVKYDTTACGIGPMAQVKVDFLRFNSFYINGNFSFGIICYNKKFPPGGDIYNFFRKTGVSFGLIFNDRVSAELGIRKLHVSNGQGVGAHNPSYEGIGAGFEFICRI